MKQLLSSLDRDGVLIQADALHTTQSYFDGASPRGPMCLWPSNPTRRPSTARSAVSSSEGGSDPTRVPDQSTHPPRGLMNS